MTDPKNPPGGTDFDELDSLLDALDTPSQVPVEAPRPPKPMYQAPRGATPPAVQNKVVPPMPPPANSPLAELSSLFDDEEPDMPTRMVDAEQIKREAFGEGHENARVSRTGLDGLFESEPRPTAQPPRMEDSLDDIPPALSAGLRSPAMPGFDLNQPFEELALEDDEVAKRAGLETAEHVAPPPSIPAPDDADLAPEMDARVDDDAEVAEFEEVDGDGPALEASSDDGPEFEMESGEETVLEVEDDEPVQKKPSEADRGALLAATVTSRRKHLEPQEVLGAGDARVESEARVALLIAEAEQCEVPSRAAEMFAIAGEILEGILGDRSRAREMFERAFDFAPNEPFILRSLRRIALTDGDIGRAREYCESELELPLSDEEREELEVFTAEVGAREGPGPAEDRWQRIAESGGTRGALAALFLGGSRRDQNAIGAALGVVAQSTSGSLAAAANLARARVAEGAAEGETALAAVQAAVQRDPSDIGSWLAMARIAIGRENAAAFREAIGGIARVASDSAAGWGAIALDRATGGVLSDPVPPTVIPTAGAGAWLVLHALRDSALDETAQIEMALSHANATQSAPWTALRAGDTGDASEVGRFLALRRAAAGTDAVIVAATAAALLSDDEVERAALESALLARKGEIASEEVSPLEIGSNIRIPELGSALVSAKLGVDAAEQRVPVGDGAFGRVAELERGLRTGAAAESARSVFAEIADGKGPLGVRVYAARESARLSSDLLPLVASLRQESAWATESKRSAALKFLSGTVGAGLATEGAAADGLEAALDLPGDIAAAELVALFGVRGDVSPAEGAQVLAAAAGDASSTSLRMAAVRAALRRAATDPDGAAESLYSVWNSSRADGALAALTLRALPHNDSDRRAEVLRDIADRSQNTSPPAALASWTLLAHTLAEANKPAEAAQALARARTLALTDPALLAWEERLWLSGGMFAEVAERSFDALKAATNDEARIAAYEKLAELDSAFRNDVASAVLTYQAILELAPGHMASLRTLERYFIEQGRYDELLGIYDRLIRHVADPEDANAIAHAAARIAIRQAEGDHGAGTPFWLGAFERGAADMRIVVELDAESRRSGETRRYADLMARGETLATDPSERATFATRAGEALLSLGEAAAAVEALDRAVAASPTHPSALTWLAHAQETAGNFAGAAEALEALARSTKVPTLAVSAFLRAAILWQDKVNDVDRARLALKEVTTREPSQPEAFSRSLRVLKDKHDPTSELALLESRLSVGGEPGEMLPLHIRAAELAEEQGDATRARTSLRAALAIEPDRQEALRALARLAQSGSDWAVAADSMIKLARLTSDNDERSRLMFSLGEIFDQHLADPKRAEAAFKHVLKLLPGDTKTLARLADLYARTDEGAAPQAETLRALIQATPPGASRRAMQIRLAAVMSEKLGEGKKAEEVLEAARREAPTDMDVLRAFARLYVRQEAPTALAVLLDRAAGEVRRQLDADLTSAPLLELLADILKLRGRVDAARVVAAVAQGLGVATEKLASLSREGTVPGAGLNALTLEALELLAPPTVTTAHRELLRLSADVLEKLMPFEPGAVRAEKLGQRPHPVRAEIERWAKTFGLESIEIYLGPATPLVVMPIGRHPPAVMIPIELRESHVASFAISRAMALVALSLPLVVRLQPREISLAISALLRQFDPMFVAEGLDVPRLDDVARRITRVLPRPRHTEMSPHAFEIIGGRGTDGEAIAAGAIELANRVALLASGDVTGAIAALTPPGDQPRTGVVNAPVLGRLVRVAISDRFLEARHLTGADKRVSTG